MTLFCAQGGHRPRWRQQAQRLTVLALLVLPSCSSTPKEVRLAPPQDAVPQAPRIDGEALVSQGSDLLAASRTQEAVERLQQGIEAGASGPIVRYKLAIGLARLGRHREAAESAERAFRDSPDSPYVAALDLAVRTWAVAGEPQRAVELARDAARGDGDNLSFQNILHRAMIEGGDLSAVLREAREVLKKDETNLGAMRNLGACYLKLGKLENAAYILKQALEIRPDAELFLLMSRIRLSDQDLTGAIYYLQKAVEAHPEYIEALSALGALYAQVGDAPAAVEELRRAIALAPGIASLYLHLGNGLRGLQQYREAEEAYRKSLSIDASLAEAHYNLGILYLENQVAGLDPEVRLQRSMDEFGEYRRTKRASSARDEEVDGFIAEAKELIKIEQQRREEAQKQPEPPDEEPPGDQGDPEDRGDPGDEGDSDEEPGGEAAPPAPSPPAELPVELAPERPALPDPTPSVAPDPAPGGEPVPATLPPPEEEPVPLPEPQ